MLRCVYAKGDSILKQNSLSRLQDLKKQIQEKNKLIKNYQKILELSKNHIQKINLLLDQKLQTIKEIHKNLIPLKLSSIPNFKLSYKTQVCKQGLSGDLFQIAKIPNSSYFILLFASCDSYASNCLFLSCFLKHKTRFQVYKSSKEFINYAVKDLLKSLNPKQDPHFFYGIISKNSMSLEYSLQGDIFVGQSSKNSQIKTLKQKDISNSPLIKSKKLKNKDVFVFCSKGVLQRKNSKSLSFFKEAFNKTLKNITYSDVLDLRQTLLFACNSFAKNSPQIQDCSILTLQVSGPVLKLKKSLKSNSV